MLTLQSQKYFEPGQDIFGHDFAYWIGKYVQQLTYTSEQKDKNAKEVYFISNFLDSKLRELVKKHFVLKQSQAILCCCIKYITVVTKHKFETDPAIKETMREECKKEIDIIEDLNMFLDGELLSPEIIRAMSNFFEVDNDYMAMVEGYWIFLRPYMLDKGEHSITTFSSCRFNKVQIPQEYDFTIV